MAKTRSKSRKPVASSTRAKAAKKPAVKRKTSAKRAKAQAEPAVLDLKKLRREIDMAVSSLARRLAMSAQPSAKLDEAQTAFSRWAAEIDNICDPSEIGICGPTMLVPLS